MNEVKNLFVSSKNRDTTLYPSGNNYVLHLTNPIKDIHKVELLTCSVPNSLYNITNGSNVVQANNSADVLTGYSIPEGFYSGSGLANEVRSAVYLTSNIEVIYKGNEGKFMFKRTPIQPFDLSFKNEQIARIFGFTDNLLKTSQNPPALGNPMPLYSENETVNNYSYLKSNVVANLNPNDGIFLDISELRTPFNEDCKKSESQFNFYSGQNISRTFGLIPMDVSSGAIKNFKKETDYDLTTSYPNPISSLDRLTIQWLDKDGHRVNFNGADDNSFILRFHTLRRSL